ncbi:hypothetical protein [Jatrophihabitans sp.]|uniref:hypothetical protein n=1 Tax=Jatrophihabitans sp. TaxID=1932789 RepID=UPI002CC6BD5A|nr:hypothetical protein [Jatrophihabitans sp.]
MTDSASRLQVERLDDAWAAARREEQVELEQARLRDQELADRLAQTLSSRRPIGAGPGAHWPPRSGIGLIRRR